MDYGKSGAVKVGKNTPRFKDNAPKEGQGISPKGKAAEQRGNAGQAESGG